MEHLTKQQLVLIGILISFVTSIATGIVTISLSDQAPRGITQTINNVVERTIERVVTEPSQNSASPVSTKETIIVKDTDRVPEAIENARKYIVKVYGVAGISIPGEIVSLGVMVSKSGLIATDASIFDVIRASYFVELPDGKRLDATPVTGIAGRTGFLQISTKDMIAPASLGDSDKLRLGQTVVTLAGGADTVVAEGIITRFVNTETPPEPPKTDVEKTLYSFFLSNTLQDKTTGGPVVNLSGEVVGLRVYVSADNAYSSVPSNTVYKLMKVAEGVMKIN